VIPQILHVHALRRQENKKVLLTYWYYTAISAISTIQELSDSDGRLQVAVNNARGSEESTGKESVGQCCSRNSNLAASWPARDPRMANVKARTAQIRYLCTVTYHLIIIYIS
jgi:hypothetical protein